MFEKIDAKAGLNGFEPNGAQQEKYYYRGIIVIFFGDGIITDRKAIDTALTISK